MQLRQGATKAAIRANIRRLIKSGKSQRQAVAIAMQKAGKEKMTKGNARQIAAANLRKKMKA